MLAAVLLGATAPTLAQARDRLVIPNAALVKYVVDSSRFVHLRNLNEVDATWAGCCNNFWINTNTEGGNHSSPPPVGARQRPKDRALRLV